MKISGELFDKLMEESPEKIACFYRNEASVNGTNITLAIVINEDGYFAFSTKEHPLESIPPFFIGLPKVDLEEESVQTNMAIEELL